MSRTSTPVFGEQSPYLKARQFQLSVGYRGLKSKYPNMQGDDVILVPSGVVNKQQIEDFTLTYAFTKQTNLSVSVPVSGNSFSYLYGPTPIWTIPLNNRPRATMRAGGLGNISLIGRRWLLPVEKCSSGNISLGFGVQFPTGNDEARAIYPNITDGRNLSNKPVDISVQPGDGGFGLIGEVQAFKTFKTITLYGTGLYLANPRNANKTQSLIVGLLGGRAASAPNFWNEYTNTVPDLYVGELGASIPLPVKYLRRLSVSMGARVEGLPPVDLIGGNAGFRRPAVVLFYQPGVSYTYGKNTLAIRVPIRAYANVLDSPNSARTEEATVAKWIFLANIIRRF